MAVKRTTIVNQLPQVDDRIVIPTSGGGALAWTVTDRFHYPPKRRPAGKAPELEQWTIYLRRRP